MTKTILVVGAGISGATVARVLAEKDYQVDVFEKSNSVGGACEDKLEAKNDSYIQYHGSHIFHTNNKEVWDFLSRFTEWSPYIHKVKALINGDLLSLPLNRNCLSKLPKDVRSTLESVKFSNLVENYARDYELNELQKVASDFIFENVFEFYSTKQWGEIPSKEVLSRVKAYRNTVDERYFLDKYQGIPKNGYTTMIENMLTHENIKVYKKQFVLEDSLHYDRVFYSGPLDELLNYGHGELPYRTCEFKYTFLDHPKHQECAVINYTQNYDFTRTHDYSYYLPVNKAVIATEYPKAFDRFSVGHVRYYPINNAKTKELYQKYVDTLTQMETNITLIGRLGLYQYLDMDKAVLKSLDIANSF